MPSIGSKLLWIGSIVMLVAAVNMVFRGSMRYDPPLAAVASEHQRVRATAGEPKVRGQFEVRNAGSGTLLFGEATTSCGCAVASISPRRLVPGQKATITLEGSAPITGEKSVQASIETNAANGPIEVRMTMVGATLPPYVLRTDGPIRFGVVRREKQQGALTILTQELADQTPWLASLIEKPTGTEVEGPEEGLVVRKYRFKVTICEPPREGAFRGVMTFGDPSGPSSKRHREEYEGLIRPPVYSAPASLYANSGPDQSPPTLHFVVKTDDINFPLELNHESTTSELYRLTRVDSTAQRSSFRVDFPEPITRSVTTAIEFQTNHPDHPSLRIPLMVRVADRPTDPPTAR
jgi:hypothetical protein